MRKTIKAVLFSGLVFPGTGHFSLKKYRRGLIFFVPALVSILLLARYTLNKAYDIANQLEQGQVPFDPVAISNLAIAPPAATDVFLLNAAAWIFIACWVVGMIDSYRLGKLADKAGNTEHAP